MYSFNLLQKIEYLSKNKQLVLLRSCNSQWQNGLLTKLAAGRTVVNLADPMVRERATWQPEQFLNQYDGSLLLKNIQFVPQLLPLLCSAANTKHCIVVASQTCNIMEEIVQLQDVEVVELPVNERQCVPFLPVQEQLQALPYAEASTEAVFQQVFAGNLMNAELTETEREVFLGEYVQNLLQHDIKMATPVSDEMKFYRFMCAVAANVSKPLNAALLGNAVDVSSPTAKLWLSYLEGAGIITLLYPIESDSLKRVAKAPKVYFTDTGLAAYLLRLHSGQEVAMSTFADALFENWVVLQMRNSFLQNGFQAHLSYFRDSNAKEINILLEYTGVIYPIDIKKEPAISVRKVQKKFALLAPMEASGEYRLGNGCLLSICPVAQQLDEKLWVVPVSAI